MTQSTAALRPLCTLPDPAQLAAIPDGDPLALVEYLITDGFAVVSIEGVAAWYDQSKPCAKDDRDISVNRRALQTAFRQLADDGQPVTVSMDDTALYLASGARQYRIGAEAEAPAPAHAPPASNPAHPALSLLVETLRRGQTAVDGGLLLAIAISPQEQTVFHFLPDGLHLYRMTDGRALKTRDYPPTTFEALLEALCRAK
jgi:hypothetical protein